MIRLVISNPDTFQSTEELYFSYSEYYADFGRLHFLYPPTDWNYRLIECE